MNEQWNATDALPNRLHERKDTLPSSGAFSVSPFDEPDEPVRTDDFQTQSSEQAPDAAPAEALNIQRLILRRKTPAAKLLSGSVLSLKTWQMDLDSPPSPKAYIRQQLVRFLADNGPIDNAEKLPSPDELYVRFSTETDPEIQVDGHEHYALQLSLTEIVLASLEPAGFLALIKCVEADRPLFGSTPLLTIGSLIEFIYTARWEHNYCQLVEQFWAHHEATYCALAKLSFVDGLSRQYIKKKITLEGYTLALGALGLDRFPTTLAELEQPTSGERAAISLLSLNGRTIPGIFQLKSKVTSHCFIHTLGNAPTTIEYIDDEQNHSTAKQLEALNGCAWLAPLVDGVPLQDNPNLSANLVDGDLFAALTAAQKAFSLEALTDLRSGTFSELDDADDEPLFKDVERGLALVSVIDLWQQPDVSKRIPHPEKVAHRLVRNALIKRHQLDLSPDTVFIRYVRGSSTSPLGSAHAPVTFVHVPNETPISLTRALLCNYRVDRPVGYLDNGARSVVYSDPSGKGIQAEDTELPLSPDAVESLIKDIDFLPLMTNRLNGFWKKHAATIERSLATTLITQLVIALKMGHVSRVGFDMLVEALEYPPSQTAPSNIRCKSLGFYLQPALAESKHCQRCAGLLVFFKANNPRRVLYQAGQAQTFVELDSRDELIQHIVKAAGNELWRTTLLNYVPVNQHQKLIYVLEIWAGQRFPEPPVTLLRPWTDVIYADHLHKAKAKTLCEQTLTSSPFVFMRETLARNHQADANDCIVTSEEITLRYWMQQINHLRLLLEPLSLLLVPARVASVLAHAGAAYLSIKTANLPGHRDTEKRLAVLTTLSLGLFQLAPLAHGLLRALSAVVRPRTLLRAGAVLTSSYLPRFSLLLRGCVNPRKTTLQAFFNTTRLMKTWAIPGNKIFGTSAVQVWKLDRKFLLWTSDQRQARTLVVSTHGYYLPWTKTTPIPNGTELRTFAPHGSVLVDPALHRVVAQQVRPFSTLNAAGNHPAAGSMPPFSITDRLMAGTSLPGRIKNYSLAKFQGSHGESYQDISHVVRNSNQSPWRGAQLPAVPMDVLTVRNRFAMAHPTLQDLFKSLSEHGIHYDRILLLHCRCSAISAALRLSPTYTAPINTAPPSPGP
ncbi:MULTISPECIES: dermonecrotic toxin domain-containing protein [unclassified Pseudomonas]|uniref:dermonecrotic toxin domain-containing protein n=1 Tax=unclassified Pseudomonas TaxID=196821 RepID=UPI002B2375EC|nr:MULTISPECIES: DUF6543 domain-containing protein [unclassified Pseudomonas]MEA9979141.1 hypothetical protein [Pseudomonas sp. RTS4]MEB0197150.1 hypothetical protein [Pseudomonas sp. 5S4]MEB0246239.1 hypothetical protein [Pseudomonas sp. 10S5]